jgi:hypothetical protein
MKLRTMAITGADLQAREYVVFGSRFLINSYDLNKRFLDELRSREVEPTHLIAGKEVYRDLKERTRGSDMPLIWRDPSLLPNEIVAFRVNWDAERESPDRLIEMGRAIFDTDLYKSLISPESAE